MITPVRKMVTSVRKMVTSVRKMVTPVIKLSIFRPTKTYTLKSYYHCPH